MNLRLNRRAFTAALAAGAAGAVAPGALAQAYPQRPVTVVVPAVAGGMSDGFVTLLGDLMKKEFGQPVVMEFRGGAGGTIATKYVSTAAPDGYTLLLGNIGPLAISPAMDPQLNYDASKDLTPISLIITSPNVLVVNPKSPVQSVQDLVALAKARPGKLSFSSAGVGSSHHLAGELFKLRAGVDMVHVPYKGGAPAVADLIGGHVDMMFSNTALVAQQVQSGALRAVAVTGRGRSQVFPNLPTIGESGMPGYEVTSWLALVGPANMPAAVVGKLNEAMQKVLQSEAGKAQLKKFGGEAGTGTAAEFRDFMLSEQRKWAEVVKKANIKSA